MRSPESAPRVSELLGSESESAAWEGSWVVEVNACLLALHEFSSGPPVSGSTESQRQLSCAAKAELGLPWRDCRCRFLKWGLGEMVDQEAHVPRHCTCVA